MKSHILTLITACICGLIGGAVSQFFLSNAIAQPAEGGLKKIDAKQFSLVYDPPGPQRAGAADIYVDTAQRRTRIDLRDPKGRLGMIISVSETPKPNANGVPVKAQIDFFDQQGNRIGSIDGTNM